MKKAGVAELKASLSEYLAAVKSGQDVLITERGHPIARITPLPVHKQDSRSIENLIRAGVLRPPEKPIPEGFWKASKPADPEGTVLSALVKERQQDR